MSSPPYMQEAWFRTLQTACAGRQLSSVARRLGLSKGAISQVLNGTGRYGAGAASTERIAAKVTHVLDRFDCPHLSGESMDGPVVISAAQCRAYALRPAPTSSPREMQHWMACRQCPHQALAANLPAAAPTDTQKAKQKTEGGKP